MSKRFQILPSNEGKNPANIDLLQLQFLLDRTLTRIDPPPKKKKNKHTHRGNVPAMFLWMTFGAVQFSTYEYLQKVDFLRAKLAPARTVSSDAAGTWERASNRWDNDKDDRVLPKTASNFVYGAIAGSAGTVASYPFDITRTALAYQVRGVLKKINSLPVQIRYDFPY